MTPLKKLGELFEELAKLRRKVKLRGDRKKGGAPVKQSTLEDYVTDEKVPEPSPPPKGKPRPAQEADVDNNRDSIGSDEPYDSRKIRQTLEERYGSENVVSTTVPPTSKPNVKLAGQHKDIVLSDGTKTRVVFDKKGFPIFDDAAKYDTRLDINEFRAKDYKGQMRMATRDLREKINDGTIPKSQFSNKQLKQINSGESTIDGYTWHHHQDTGRMQLVSREVHKVSHVGWESMKEGQ